jgi:hypothetical protein
MESGGKEIASDGQRAAQEEHPTTQLNAFFTTGFPASSSQP